MPQQRDLQNQIGTRVVAEAVRIQDYVQIQFAGEPPATLTVLNDWRVVGGGFDDLPGDQLKTVFEQSQKVLFGFSSGAVFECDLREESWHGPEAMTLHIGDDILVWN